MTVIESALLAAVPHLVMLDFETTQSASGVRPVEVAALLVEGGRVTGEVVELIQPGCRIDPWSMAVHGIDDKMVAGAPPFADLWPRLAALLEGSVVAAHYAPFDSMALRNEIVRLRLAPPQVDWWCTCRFARKLWPELDSHKLGSLAVRFSLTGENRHRAAEDASLALELLKLELEVSARRGCRCVADVLPLVRHRGKSWPYPG